MAELGSSCAARQDYSPGGRNVKARVISPADWRPDDGQAPLSAPPVSRPVRTPPSPSPAAGSPLRFDESQQALEELDGTRRAAADVEVDRDHP